MKALGLIETRGLLAAIESADTMLKAADVSIFDKTYVGGGLVSVAVTGDVGAVKAAVEAGVAAVKKLDSSLLVSEHVIPRPHEELDSIIGIKNITVSIEDSNINDTANDDTDNIDDINVIDKIDNDTDRNVNKSSDDNKDINLNKDTDISIENINEACNHNDEVNIVIENIENIADENLKDENKTKSLEIDIENLQKDTVDNLVKDSGMEKAIKVLNSLNLMNLRNLARQYDDLEITNKAISKASKKIIISKIKAYYK
ncbi:BMC domain-containing protein [Clostridium sp. MB05]|jgi:microcompartment protein CcmL/EutN